ncbi:hypothetical protein IK146_01705 [Candidatus Saccharibacteria bacterium]|nr:hypothetical protein [Candidatus Saccharibacteria bacterium]
MGISNKIKITIIVLTFAITGVIGTPANTFASTCSCRKNDDGGIVFDGACSETEKGMMVANGCAEAEPLENTVVRVVNAALYVAGILAVVMVIIGGVRYTTSGGNVNIVTKAKNTILYGIIGLVIAILAYAIVNFVIARVTV